MVNDCIVPERLRAEVARTLRPVKPLPRPTFRALFLLPLIAIVIGSVPLVWGIRHDASAIGWVRLGLGSTLQILLGLTAIAAALRDSIPGRLLSPGRLIALFASALGLLVALTAATYWASPTQVPVSLEDRYLRACLSRPFLLGMVPLAFCFAQLRRGLCTRPALSGAIAGLAAGIVADSGWRIWCFVSDPAHVLTAHAGAIVLLILSGALIGRVALRPQQLFS